MGIGTDTSRLSPVIPAVFLLNRAVLWLGAWIVLAWATPLAAWGQQAGTAVAPSSVQTRKVFVPGEIWMDTKGKPINAHGGGMFYRRGTYYWYGEDKAGHSWMPEANRQWDGYRVDVTGIHCYSSKDLLTWEDEGLVLKAMPNDRNSDLHPSKVVERPKVAYNPKTRKFVMWMHIDSADYQTARAGVAVARSATGPFKYLGSVNPEGGDSRDQTLFIDDDGKAYRIYSSEHNQATYISLLSDDWLSHSGRYARVFVGQSREAQAMFKRNDKYYLIASECTGWDPNPAHAAVANSIWGPWHELGNPCQGPNANTTFHAQSTYVFPIAGKKDAYIFMADRWNKADLPDSRYVWLPVLFDAEGPKLKWMDAWTLSFLEQDRRRSDNNFPRLAAEPGFSIVTQDANSRLVRPDGKPFFSLGVCCVNMGSARDRFNPTNPSYAAWQHYPSSNAWAQATIARLKSWGFTTVGGWSDYAALRQGVDLDLALTPVLHVGSTAGAPWWDMWDSKITGRMEQVARDQIMRLRDDPRLLGYYSDNEMGWWTEAIVKMTLEQRRTSGQRQRLLTLLHRTYRDDWSALLKDFEVEDAGDWETLERGGRLYLRPGGNGMQTVHEFLGLIAERYYSLVKQIIRKYDRRALILGDRYQSFFFPEVARACSPNVDAVSSNLNASWHDGTFPRFYLDTLHGLTGKPIFVSEFYMAAMQNRSGDRNDNHGFPVCLTQKDRARGFATTLRDLLGLPYVVGADWFQYYDEPPYGRYDGEDYDFGLVDIHDQPYTRLTRTAARLKLVPHLVPTACARSDASQGVPPAPRDPLGQFTPGQALKHWDRERGFVQPKSEFPMADLYLCWSRDALCAGLYAQDVVEAEFYRDKRGVELDRARWTFSIPDLDPIECRIGAGLEPEVSTGGVRIVNASGVNLNVRNISALQLPATLFHRSRFRAGDVIEFSSVLVTHGRAYRTEWGGRFRLCQPD
jgi:hypothetical protein